MELRHLRYFVAIAEERSITRAAERLWIAQPGLSTQIRRLEAELGIQLLDRHTRGVELTAAGEVFLERARATLAAADAARSTGPTSRPGWSGRSASASRPRRPRGSRRRCWPASDSDRPGRRGHGARVLQRHADARPPRRTPRRHASPRRRSARPTCARCAVGSEPWVDARRPGTSAGVPGRRRRRRAPRRAGRRHRASRRRRARSGGGRAAHGSRGHPGAPARRARPGAATPPSLRATPSR